MGAQKGKFKMIPNVLIFTRCTLEYLEVTVTMSATNLPMAQEETYSHTLTHTDKANLAEG